MPKNTTRFTPEQIEAAMIACQDGRVHPGLQPELKTAIDLCGEFLNDAANMMEKTKDYDAPSYFAGLGYGIAFGFATRDELERPK
jgi:hypothetical protein